MRKIYILFMSATLVFGIAACSKKDDNSSTNTTTPPPVVVDVWSKATGTFRGDASVSGGGSTSNMEITITKLSDTKVRITPGATNTIIKAIDILVSKTDTSLYQQQGAFNGSFYVITNVTPPQVVLDDKGNNVYFFGFKK